MVLRILNKNFAKGKNTVRLRIEPSTTKRNLSGAKRLSKQ